MINSITILGSSSGMPQANRASSGYLLKCGQKLTLLECGGGVTQSFLRCGFNPDDIERIFISHTHPDHCCELPLFIQLIYLRGRTRPLDIYVPEEFVEPFKIYLNAVYLIKEKLPFELNIIGYTDKFEFVDELKLKAIANNHLKGNDEIIKSRNLPNKMMCHSFEIEINQKSILYSSDLASLDDIIDYINNKDIVIVESTHIDLDKLLESALDYKVGKYIITHLGDENEIEQIKQKAQKAGVTNLVTAEDGMTIEL